MTNSNWTPDLIICLILISGALALIFTGINTEVKSILTLASGWAFATAYHRKFKTTNSVKD